MNKAAMLLTLLLLLEAVCAVSSASLHINQVNGGTIKLPTGQYIGAHDADTSTTTYYGIPFAYADRFEPARSVDTQSNLTPGAMVNASVHGPACINFGLPPPYDKGFSILLGATPIHPQSEDCLSIDVYVPDGHRDDLPVLFYTPGGGFLVGASYPYDMRYLVSRAADQGKPFIGVVTNYRLGPLGFLNPSTWKNETNLGLLDQVAALQYVQKYIVMFGGDPDKVTIMGESAGGESTMHQLLWTNENLFRSAWLMSVPATTDPFLAQEPSYKDALVKSYAKACGCGSGSIVEAVDCLRTTKVSTLVNNSVAWEGSMTSLGGFVRRNVFDAIRDGEFPRVPVVFSACRDEGTSAAIGFKSNNTQTTSIYIDNLISGRGLKGKQAADFRYHMLKAYPNDPAVGCPFDGLNTTYNQPSQFKRMAAIATDSTYVEPWSEFLATFSHKTPTWGIIFEQPIQGTPEAYGVQHGSDLHYYFPTLAGDIGNPLLHGQQDLVYAIFDALIQFVNFGDPSVKKSPPRKSDEYVWPLYSVDKLVTALNASHIEKAVAPPHRAGFDVLHTFLRPGPFWNAMTGKEINAGS